MHRIGGMTSSSTPQRCFRPLPLTLASVLLALPCSAWAEQQPVGVVASLHGVATVVRTAAPEPALLKFRDGVFVRDRISTGEDSLVRILLGGKATVTVRERSILTITEVPGTSTVSLTSGKISVAVVKDRINPGETVQIQTPNAVAAIRGTVVIAEVSETPTGHSSTITVLKGLVDVTRLDAGGSLVGATVKVGALQRVTVTTSLSPVQTITRDDAKHLSSGFSVLPKQAPPATLESLRRTALERATEELARLVPGSTVAGPVVGSVGGEKAGRAAVIDAAGSPKGAAEAAGPRASAPGAVLPTGSLTAPGVQGPSGVSSGTGTVPTASSGIGGALNSTLIAPSIPAGAISNGPLAVPVVPANVVPAVPPITNPPVGSLGPSTSDGSLKLR
jgi:hypothetical protein